MLLHRDFTLKEIMRSILIPLLTVVSLSSFANKGFAEPVTECPSDAKRLEHYLQICNEPENSNEYRCDRYNIEERSFVEVSFFSHGEKKWLEVYEKESLIYQKSFNMTHNYTDKYLERATFKVAKTLFEVQENIQRGNCPNEEQRYQSTQLHQVMPGAEIVFPGDTSPYQFIYETKSVHENNGEQWWHAYNRKIYVTNSKDLEQEKPKLFLTCDRNESFYWQKRFNAEGTLVKEIWFNRSNKTTKVIDYLQNKKFHYLAQRAWTDREDWNPGWCTGFEFNWPKGELLHSQQLTK
jgi:uncharacterized protein YkuJ